MPAPTQDLIDRLGEAAKECKELLREVHGATRDLRTAIREGEAARAKWREEAKAWVEEAWGSAESVELLQGIRELNAKYTEALVEADQLLEGLRNQVYQYEAILNLLPRAQYAP